MDTYKREWRVVKRGEEYSLRKVEVREGGSAEVLVYQPGGFQAEASGKGLPDLYEALMGGARKEIGEAFERPVVEVS